MSIEIRDIANDSLVGLGPELAGLHIQTDFTDTKGRLVSGSFEQATTLDNGKIAIKLTRDLNGNRVLDSVTVPSGNDPFGRPFRTLLHIPAGSPVLQRVSWGQSAHLSCRVTAMGLLKRLFGGSDAAVQQEHPVVPPAATVAPTDTFRTGRPQAADGPADWPTDPESGLVFDDAWLLAGLKNAVNENQYQAKLEAREDMATLRRERLVQPGLDGHDQQADMLRGRDWLEWTEHVHQMKREGYLECALALVCEMMDTARGSAYWDHKPPPGWYDQAAIILRRLRDFGAEVRLMEEALRNYPGSEDFSRRLEKAKALQLKT